MSIIQHEEWRSVNGYEGFYEVSNMGRVRSLERFTSRGLKGGNVLATPPSAVGYSTITLCRDGTQKCAYVHHLVAAAFLGPRPYKHDICHNDGDRLNNEAANLRYDTRAGNFADMHVHGTRYVSKRRKLTPDVVRLIRSRLDEGQSGRSLAFEYDVTPAAITHIKQGKNWSHLD
ncbi:NUMOD4 motif-containing protein [Sphingobium sp. AP50]|uniref:NUMOD4 domain-containing protein n=1 Tax=Sphingobium sp. AP50 TaxID=1884369 RepID=UPI0008CB3255|nr:NUMOD4 domain-containing protein [Sphingobium sp. AP50]SEJ87679.1 NUMOD4 motif-containing protein [Sphingobium sp. AP50]